MLLTSFVFSFVFAGRESTDSFALHCRGLLLSRLTRHMGACLALSRACYAIQVLLWATCAVLEGKVADLRLAVRAQCGPERIV